MKLIVLVLVNIFIVQCTVFKKEETLLAEYICSNGDRIRIYFVAVGATAQDNIQVRKLPNNKIIAAFEKYNYLKTSNLINDSLLQVVLSDTGYNKTNKLVTLTVRLK